MVSTHQIVDLSAVLRDADDQESTKLVVKFRTLRLDALQTSPEAFASTYEAEVQRDIEQSFQRLRNPNAVHLIAVRDQLNPPALSEQEWLGMIVLLGPEDESASATVSAKSDPFARMTSRTMEQTPVSESPVVRSWHYHLNGVFVQRIARKAGLGIALIKRALDEAGNYAQLHGVRNVVFTISVDSDNQAAQHLYETVGFKATGSEKYMQQPRGLVDGESETTERTAIHMDFKLNVRGCS